MKNEDFKRYLIRAKLLCDDYSEDEDSGSVDMIWFTPVQLKKYTEYCIQGKTINKTLNNEEV